MTSMRQFWTLFRFQLGANPYIWFTVMAFCAPQLLFNSGHESLIILIPAQNIFFVGFLGVMFLAPEIIYSAANSSQWAAYGSEFLLTRAVDRDILARARTGCFYFLILIIPFLIFAGSLKNPDLKVYSYYKGEQQECLASIPGTALLKGASGRADVLSIPAGRRLIAAWHCWEIVGAAALVEILVFLVYPWRYRRYIFWGIYGLFILVPLADISSRDGSPSNSYHLFFLFAGHQALFWLAIMGFAVVVQLWCERRFCRQEH